MQYLFKKNSFLLYSIYTSTPFENEAIYNKRARVLIIVKKNQIYLNTLKVNEANKVTNYTLHFDKCFLYKKLICGSLIKK